VPILYDTDGPIEIAPGRGDLRYSSFPSDFAGATARSVRTVTGKQLSFARLFTEQPVIGIAVGWLLRQSLRVPLKAYRRTGEDSRERLRDHPLAAAIVDPWDRGSQAASSGRCSARSSSTGTHSTRWTRVPATRSASSRPTGASPTDPAVARHDRRLGSRPGRRHGRAHARRRPGAPHRDVVAARPGRDQPTAAARRHDRDRGRRPALPAVALPQRCPAAVGDHRRQGFSRPRAHERRALIANLREDVTALYAGPDNAGRPALLPPGLDWKEVGHTAVEAALIEQRRVAREEMTSVYGLQPGPLGWHTRARAATSMRSARWRTPTGWRRRCS
jgi:hypothetical protein